jgi:hypothetical protein
MIFKKINLLIFSIIIFSNFAKASDVICKNKKERMIKNSFDSFVQKYIQFGGSNTCEGIKLPCYLGFFNSFSEIIFVGENHSDSNSKAIKTKIFEKAQSGEIELATEVTSVNIAYPWTKKIKYEGHSLPDLPTVHPIDSPILTGVLSAYTFARINLEIDHNENVNAIFQSIKNILINPLFRGSYEKLKSTGLSPLIVKNVDKLIDKYKTIESSNFSKSENDELTSLIMAIPIDERKLFVSNICNGVINIGNEIFPEEFKKIKLPNVYSLADLDAFGVKSKNDFDKQAYQLLFPLRNIDMSSKVSRILCESKSSEKPLVILIGDGHYEGMKNILQCLFNEKLKISHFQTFAPAQSDELLKKLKINR